MRGLKGRFGADHSEILNIELELANKDRENYMNKLVYKDNWQTRSVVAGGDKENLAVSEMLFHRLSEKQVDQQL